MSCEWRWACFHLVWPLPLPCPIHWPVRGRSSQLMRWRTQVEWPGGAVSVWKVVDCVWRWICSAHTGSGLLWNVMVLSRLCCTSLWTSGGWSTFLGEWASLRKRLMLLWVCPGSSLLSLLNAHFRLLMPHPYSGHDWMSAVGFYVKEVFHDVVYRVICAPHPSH